MTISTPSNSATFLGNGAQTVFDFNFVAGDASYIQVTIVVAGVPTVVLSSLYTLTLNSAVAGSIWGVGGSVTYPLTGSPLALGSSLTIARIVPDLQLVSLTNQGSQTPQSMERGLDLLEMQIQQNTTDLTYAFTAPTTDLTPPLPTPSATARANQLAIFDNNGNLTSGVLPASGVISTAMQPVVDAATLALGRLAFGYGPGVTVLNIAALKLLPSTDAPVAIVLCYSTPGDNYPVAYASSSSACTVNTVAGGGDGGSQIPASDGGSWQLIYPGYGLTPKIWGAAGDGVTDDHVSIIAMIAYLNAFSSQPNFNPTSQFLVEMRGVTFATSVPIVLPSCTVLRNGQFNALAGPNWVSSATVALNGILTGVTFASGGTAVLHSVAGGFLTLQNISIDCGSIPNCQGFLGDGGAQYNNLIENLTVRHWASGGNGVVFTSGFVAVVRTINCAQFVYGDVGYKVYADYSGIGMGFFETFDSTIIDGDFSDTAVPIFVDPGSSTISFDNAHPYQSVDSSVTDPIGILYLGFDCSFTRTYLDKCVFMYPMGSYTNSQFPSVFITGTNVVFGSDPPTQPVITSWIQLYTAITATSGNPTGVTNLYSVTIRNNSFSSGGKYAFKFTAAGGSFYNVSAQTLTAINAAYGNPDFIGSALPGLTGTVAFSPSLHLQSIGYLRGQLNATKTVTTSPYTFTLDDAGIVINFAPSGAITLTADATITSGFTVKFVVTNYNGTVQISANTGSVNGVTTAITVTSHYLYELTWVYGTGVNAVYGLAGHGI